MEYDGILLNRKKVKDVHKKDQKVVERFFKDYVVRIQKQDVVMQNQHEYINYIKDKLTSATNQFIYDKQNVIK